MTFAICSNPRLSSRLSSSLSRDASKSSRCSLNIDTTSRSTQYNFFLLSISLSQEIQDIHPHQNRHNQLLYSSFKTTSSVLLWVLCNQDTYCHMAHKRHHSAHNKLLHPTQESLLEWIFLSGYNLRTESSFSCCSIIKPTIDVANMELRQWQ